VIDLNIIGEEQLLATRLCDLPIDIEGTWLKECVSQLWSELNAQQILFNPICYLSDEWLTPEGEVVIGIPFYLAHPVLTKLENKMMLEAEGEGKTWCMQLLRHETGHALTYAYKLNDRKDWQRMFGSSSQEYGETYKFKPYSKNFVRHLDGCYAQYHPDEDFVETFAVWLTPGTNWRETYKGHGALAKLEFVDHLMGEIKGKQPLKKRGRKLWSQAKSKMTLAKYYAKKQSSRENFPDFHDEQLNKIFKSLSHEEWIAFKKEQRKNKNLLAASVFIHANAKHLIHSINRCSGERKYIISELITNITLRARQLNMIVPGQKEVALLQLSVYVTSLVANYMHTGWYQGKDRAK